MEMLKEKLNEELVSAQERINKLKKELDNNPKNALEWSHSSFIAACTLKIYPTIIRLIDRGLSKEELKKIALVEIVATSRDKNSTNPTSNLIRDAENTAWLNALDIIELN